MRLSQILDKIKQIRHHKLPGFDAQLKMSPPMRIKVDGEDLIKYKAKESAVIILLYENEEETYIVLTQRHVYNGHHSGQISLPGGKKEAVDIDTKATAIREFHEEVGIKLEDENILMPLSWLYVPPSNFVIYPFVAYVDETPNFVKEEAEVEEILEIKLIDFLNELNHKKYHYFSKQHQISIETPCFQFDNYVIWGATAMILSEFFKVIES